jgi:hypothetical protein
MISAKLEPSKFSQSRTCCQDSHRWGSQKSGIDPGHGGDVVAKTGPYFHDGQTTSLEQAVKDMATYQLGKPLTDPEVDAIVAFLGVLTGRIDPEYIAPPALPPSTERTPRPDPN